MASDSIRSLLSQLRTEDISIDEQGRIFIMNAAIAERLKGVGGIRPDVLKNGDTNIICCGNGSCAQEGTLGPLVDRFSKMAG